MCESPVTMHMPAETRMDVRGHTLWKDGSSKHLVRHNSRRVPRAMMRSGRAPAAAAAAVRTAHAA